MKRVLKNRVTRYTFVCIPLRTFVRITLRTFVCITFHTCACMKCRKKRQNFVGFSDITYVRMYNITIHAHVLNGIHTDVQKVGIVCSIHVDMYMLVSIITETETNRQAFLVERFASTTDEIIGQ